ncbi:zinc finger protein 527-like [Neocloeon triangulifer]|uniref:zinc finger protein 527-like n=1 Tax=Neocloeon triangulifer TaxID=2078957 RepID=UPI00286EFAFA|nr:zinc finger protein 527-like [Neocloeon triangulifer]
MEFQSKQLLQCPVCLTDLKNMTELKAHVGPKRCHKCKKNLSCVGFLEEHIADGHPSGDTDDEDARPGTVKCEHCGWKFAHQIHLDAHRRKVKCPRCPLKFECRAQLEAHLAEETVQCRVCRKKYHSAAEVLQHESQTKCTKCGNGFKCETFLKNHVRYCSRKTKASSAPVKLDCDFCKKKLLSAGTYLKHVRERTCKTCGESSQCFALFCQHNMCEKTTEIQKQMKEPVEEPPLKIVPAGTNCPYCKQICPTAVALTLHTAPSECPRCRYVQPCNTLLAKHLDMCRFKMVEKNVY